MELKSEPNGEDDMKGMLKGFTGDLDAKEKAKAQKALDDARPVQEKLKAEFEKQQAAAAAPRAGPGTATARPKKDKPKPTISGTDPALLEMYGL